jgi:hypothetical protein
MKLTSPRNIGVDAARVSAVLFGAGTPLAKMLLDSVSPCLVLGESLPRQSWWRRF